MIRFLLGRLVGLLLTLWISSFVVFAALYLAPGDPISFLTGGREVSPLTLAELRHQYQLDQPFLVRYADWLGGVLHGHLGQSIVAHQDVSTLIGARAQTSALLVGYAAVLIILGGIAAGTIAALFKGPLDSGITLGTTVGLALPSFVTAIALISVFAVDVRWFPVFGDGSGLLDRLWHLTLPAIALAVSSSALIARITRGALREELGREHVETARSRGIPRRKILRRHVLRNGMIPVTTVAGITVAGLVAGSVVVERAFNLNGLGSFLVQSVAANDFPAVQAVVLLMVAVFVILSTVVDLLYPLIDPRMARGGTQ
ncbi:ABC transporter permease [Streptomyces atratus]|uniref:ABC transporter permease n=1 Tax=Streptomyces atratus TaxID=1893 RepID=UPI00167001B6|nr:ABC transporter permease [Streptomyces atratus]WPW26308.1 ABC transporter permease [Streptomyces atratus]GGT65833.1 ABC transporter permease [Streptomyces atratus]